MSAIDPTTAAQRLIQVLSSAAVYNDKGWQWSGGHPLAQQVSMRRGYQETLQALAEVLGIDALGRPLAVAIANGEASRDGSGCYVELAQARFGGISPR